MTSANAKRRSNTRSFFSVFMRLALAYFPFLTTTFDVVVTFAFAPVVDFARFVVVRLRVVEELTGTPP